MSLISELSLSISKLTFLRLIAMTLKTQSLFDHNLQSDLIHIRPDEPRENGHIFCVIKINNNSVFLILANH